MDTRTVEARVVTIEVGGNRVLNVARFQDPAGRDKLTLATGWQEDGPMPGPRGETLEVPGALTSELIEALREVEGGS